MSRSVLISTLLTAAILGCATHPKVDPKINWNARIGSYTYDQAIAELGPPDLTTGLSGGGQTAQWITRQSPQMSFGAGVGTGAVVRGAGSEIGVGSSVSPPASGEDLLLTFGPDGKLKELGRGRH